MRYFQVNAFTSRPQGGNPAGVCPLDTWPDTSAMQAFAASMTLAEIAFFVAQDEGFDLRWFTPLVEMDLCGHATLASAHVLFRHLGYARPEVKFYTRSGELRVARAGEELVMDLPARPALPCDAPTGLAAALGAPPRQVLKARDLLCVYDTEQQVRELRPRFAEVAALGVHAVIVTAPGDCCDFVSRFFAPSLGVDEDPVTGSAHCTLVPYWAMRLGRSRLEARQVSARGGELGCELAGDRVILRGRAVTVLEGQTVD
jgi:predicted PhzF superfamily epimerase YddE/YHI9